MSFRTHEGVKAVAYDLIIKGADVVRPNEPETQRLDIGIRDGKVVDLVPDLDTTDTAEVVDAAGMLAFPGAVDAHCHWGIYNSLAEDAVSESRAAAQGGTTTAMTYFRTGQYYLNRGGPYREFFPNVLDIAQGKSFVDYAFHLAPMEQRHIEEIPMLIEEFGVPSFKIFMFYGTHGLHGRSDDQSSFLMTPPDERYDYAHFEFIMRAAQKAREQFPNLAEQISVSLHCETAEIMTAYTRMVEEDGTLRGLEAYSASRPPHSEGLAITIAAYLAHASGFPNINLLHLSSAKAIEAALLMRDTFPHINFRREVTVGHLLADITTANGLYGKVNPPLRPREDVEALWDAVIAGDVDWVVSDHACCKDEMKMGEDREDVFQAKSGFGGTEYLLSGVYSEGTRRGLAPNRIAQLVSWNPAQRFGLSSKGDLGVGFDADIVLLNPNTAWTIHSADSESAQGYSVFEGFDMQGRVEHVWVRGTRVVDATTVVGMPTGQYLSRPQ